MKGIFPLQCIRTTLKALYWPVRGQFTACLNLRRWKQLTLRTIPLVVQFLGSPQECPCKPIIAPNGFLRPKANLVCQRRCTVCYDLKKLAGTICSPRKAPQPFHRNPQTTIQHSKSIFLGYQFGSRLVLLRPNRKFFEESGSKIDLGQEISATEIQAESRNGTPLAQDQSRKTSQRQRPAHASC